MTGASNVWLRDPRLAAHALSPTPAWLWSADATRILWANPVGAAIIKTDNDGTLDEQRFDPEQGAAAQVARLAATLPNGAMPRLERLRGFGAALGATLTCICSRIEANGETAILIVATERAGPELPLDTRLRLSVAGLDDAVAAFSADGELMLASASGTARLGGATTLEQLGAEALAHIVSRDGHAAGRIGVGDVTFDRLSAGSTFVLLMTMAADTTAPAQMEAEAQPAPATLAAAEATPAPPVASGPPTPEPPPIKRGKTLRFVWHSDADDRFVLESEEFVALTGWTTKAALGSPWKDFAAALGLDADSRIAGALASHQTWSGISVTWPVDGTTERVAVELSGLPVFGRDQSFEGYRGFGLCRDAGRLAELAQARAAAEAAKERADAEAKTDAEAKAAAPAAAALQAATQPTAAPLEPAAGEADEESAANVVRFPAQEAPGLDAREQKAFSEIARELSNRLKKTDGKPINDDDFGPERPELIGEPEAEKAAPARTAVRDGQTDRSILDRLPIGILVYRLNDLLYANRAFLEWTDYATLDALREAGGLDSLFIETNAPPPGTKSATPSLSITTPGGKRMPVEGRLFPASWGGENALVLMLNITKAADKSVDLARRRIEDENRELRAVLDTATDGVVMIDGDGRVLSANRSAEALFGYEAEDFAKLGFGDLFAPESRRTVLEYLDRLGNGSVALLNEGREVIGRVRQGGLVPLYVTIGRLGENSGKLCAVFRDVTAWKRTEEDLINAKRQAETASSAKSEFLAKISHEIRSPLNAIIGFSEVMMAEQFGPIDNERYRQYLRDIHASGGHLTALLNDLLDLSKIEAGKLDLTFTGVNLNDLAQQCVAILQQQANRERVIIRTSLPPGLPQIVADARSVRQIVLNLLSNSIKFTGTGGQVIVSTALSERNEVVLHVRDTGAGMSPHELQTALEPFRQLATSARWGASGTGLGLPITKALAEANHAKFTITSAIDDGTLVEIAFPAPRVLTK